MEPHADALCDPTIILWAQLCINYANERLQALFNADVFAAAEAEAAAHLRTARIARRPRARWPRRWFGGNRRWRRRMDTRDPAEVGAPSSTGISDGSVT